MNSDDRIPGLSGKEALVLELLLQNPARAMYGLEMVAGSRSKLKLGTVYSRWIAWRIRASSSHASKSRDPT
jgi:hypothetical protein